MKGFKLYYELGNWWTLSLNLVCLLHLLILCYTFRNSSFITQEISYMSQLFLGLFFSIQQLQNINIFFLKAAFLMTSKLLNFSLKHSPSAKSAGNCLGSTWLLPGCYPPISSSLGLTFLESPSPIISLSSPVPITYWIQNRTQDIKESFDTFLEPISIFFFFCENSIFTIMLL